MQDTPGVKERTAGGEDAVWKGKGSSVEVAEGESEVAE